MNSHVQLLQSYFANGTEFILVLQGFSATEVGWKKYNLYVVKIFQQDK